MKTELFSLENKVVGEIDIPDEVFGVAWNPNLVSQVLNAMMANQRTLSAHAKDRSEVSGGGRKPWRQKGTGRARHGSIRSPIWRGGGKAHGPTSERDYSQKINKKMRRLALFSILSKKMKDKDIKFFDKINITDGKTKLLAEILRNILGLNKRSKKYDLLIVSNGEKTENLLRSSVNLPKVFVSSPYSLNIHDLLSYRNVFIDQGAVEIIKGHYQLDKKKI